MIYLRMGMEGRVRLLLRGGGRGWKQEVDLGGIWGRDEIA